VAFLLFYPISTLYFFFKLGNRRKKVISCLSAPILERKYYPQNNFIGHNNMRKREINLVL